MKYLVITSNTDGVIEPIKLAATAAEAEADCEAFAQNQNYAYVNFWRVSDDFAEKLTALTEAEPEA